MSSVEELFDCITRPKLYDTLHGVTLRYISSDTFIYTVQTVLRECSPSDRYESKPFSLVYPDVLNVPCHIFRLLQREIHICVVLSALWNSFVSMLNDMSRLMPEERDALNILNNE